MANAAFRASASRPETTAQTRQTVLKDVSAKWGKFSEDDLAALNGRDDLVAQIVTKYGDREDLGSARRGRPAEGPPGLTRNRKLLFFWRPRQSSHRRRLVLPRVTVQSI